MNTNTIPRVTGQGLLFRFVKRFALRLFILIVAVSGAAAARADGPSPSEAAKFWKASLQGEVDKNYDDALGQVMSYQQQGGDGFLATLRAGWLSYLKKDYTQAAIFYTRANQMQPSAVNPLVGLLNVAQARGDTTSVQSVSNLLLRIGPPNYRAQMALAGICYADKDYRGALSYYTRVLVNFPEDTDATSGAAWCSFYLADPERAFEGFSKILSVNPDYPYAQQGYGLTAGRTSGGLQPGSLQTSSGLQTSGLQTGNVQPSTGLQTSGF